MDDDFVELFATFIVQHPDSEDLFAHFYVQIPFEDLFCHFIVKQWQEDLLSAFWIRQNNDYESGKVVVIYEDDESVLSVFFTGIGTAACSVVKDTTHQVHGDSCAELHFTQTGGNDTFEIRREYGAVQDWSKKDIIHIYFYGLNSGRGLAMMLRTAFGTYRYWNFTDDWLGFARFPVPLRSGYSGGTMVDAELANILSFGVFISGIGVAAFDYFLDRTIVDTLPDLRVLMTVRNVGSVDLPCEFEVDHFEELFCHFISRHSDSADLKSEFIARQAAEEELFAKFIARHSDALDLSAEFIARHSSSEDLISEMIVRHSATTDLSAEFVSRHSDAVDLPSEFISRQSGSQNLFCKFIVRHSATTNLFAKFIVRHSGTAEFFARFISRQSGYQNLFAKFVVLHSATADLKCGLWVRFPTRLWTNRRYINGVIDLAEGLIGDAILEYVIEGVMEDIQGYLDNQEVAYNTWTDVTLVPTLLRRATTYGVVASLYARHTKTFTSRVIPSVAPVTVTVIGDAERAMDYWEKKMTKALESYLAYSGGIVMKSSTEDEEPVFSMADIPAEVSDEDEVSWHEWTQQQV